MSDSSPPSNPAERVQDLEEKVMFQQRALDELNSVVLEQQGELERLRREVKALRDMAERALERSGEDLPHEKPPHY